MSRTELLATIAVTVIAGLAAGCSAATTRQETATGPPAGLTASFRALRNAIDATIGVALAPLGGSEPPTSFGDWQEGPAWSTMKVPLVMAALHEPGATGLTSDMVAAITASDNDAAEAIWVGLGDPVTAADKVESVLRAAGDSTEVQPRRVRPPYSAFGQSNWGLEEQAVFLSMASCDSANEPVLHLMGQIASDQRWGLGTFTGAEFKGGWGPDLANRYLVRQMALVPTPGGAVAISVAAQPASGSFEDGRADLTAVAEWLRENLDALPSGTCAAR